jgi:hypothetical protein
MTASPIQLIKFETPDVEEDVLMQPIARLHRDLKSGIATLTGQEVRFLVDAYYATQHYRIQAKNQIRAATAPAEPQPEGDESDDDAVAAEEPHDVLSWHFKQMKAHEDEIKKVLDAWTNVEPSGMGAWSKEIIGIGPVLAAGLLAHIDITKAPTAGHIWSFAGLNPNAEWIGKEKAREIVKTVADSGAISTDQIDELARILGRNAESLQRMARFGGKGKPDLARPTTLSLTRALSRRPWNAALKVICWKIGQSFVKVSGNENARYGQLYRQRKAYEAANNERGLYAEQAAKELTEKRYGDDTAAKKFYLDGKLPPAHIQARAERWTTKIFLSHWQAEAYRRHFGVEPPAPFPIAILNHAHVIQP